jgi:deoxycytidine triphosphate deaminase
VAEHPDITTRRERERKHLLELRDRCPKDDKHFPFTGVLLSDAIKKCCDDFALITPFSEQNLKPANYKLTIGDEYALRGRIKNLSDTPGDNELTIDPYEVVILKTREIVNMPPFLIARWNIQVSKAYKGLVWVGGPQVDAGYVGHLFCPIYNLSDKPVTLYFGDAIAVIDFERTSHIHPEAKTYKEGGLPDRILLQDYELFDSALATQVQDNITDFRGRVESLSSRMDIFVTITFALLGILFAAGALYVTPPQSDRSHLWDLSIFGICVLAIALSGWAVVRSHSGPRPSSRMVEVIWIVVFIILVGIGFSRQERLTTQLNELKNEVHQLQKPPSENSDGVAAPTPERH